MREGTFRSLLTDIVHSLKQHGFENIILIGDSGGNQAGQRFVADSLTEIWKGAPVVAHVQEYYTYSAVSSYMSTRGITEGQSDGLHDDIIITLNMLIADPKSVRLDERIRADKATINGFSIADKARSLELAKQIVDFRADYTIEAIKRAIANKGTLPAGRRGGGAGGVPPTR
jgi:creatinine amidohydrolase/Fe(II)-dependent formamide hydrolase-like protein